MEGDKDQSIKLLKEALKLIHGYFERMKSNKPESTEQEKKDKIKMHKYLRYVLDQVIFELSCIFTFGRKTILQTTGNPND